MRHFARCLIACETKGNKGPNADVTTAFPIPEKLRLPLTALMGTGGFRALQTRSLVLATVEVRWLRTLLVNAEGALVGVETLHSRIDPAEFLEGRVVLLAHLLGLLVAFIGPQLTLRLVAEIWPKILRSTLDLGHGDKNEEKK